MNRTTLVRQIGAVISVLICSVASYAQWSKKPYTEWSEKDAEKVLSDSPWVKTVGFTGPVGAPKINRGSSLPPSTNPDPFDRRLPADPRLETKLDRPGTALHVNCRVRLLSAQPMLEAFSRSGVIPHSSEGIAAQLRAVDADPTNRIIIAISCDSKENSGFLTRTRYVLSSRPPQAPFGVGFADTFLENNEGKRVPPEKHLPPRDDRVGALLIFPRFVEGTPLIATGSSELRFYRKAAKEFSIDVRFKPQDMIFDGKLEY